MSARIRVLYAEDDPAHADLTQAHFARTAPEFEIEIVDRGEAFQERVRGNPNAYDALLLDNHLPDMDGIDVLRNLLRSEIKLPVVMVTGVGDEKLVVEALRLGAYDYVPKTDSRLETLPVVLRSAIARFRESKAPGQAIAEPPRHILYIEELQSEVDATLLHFAQVAPHFRVDVIRSCEEALRLLARRHDFDLVLLDLQMPGMSGLELLRSARYCGASLPFVCIANSNDEETAIAALKLGAYDYVIRSENYLTQLAHCIDHSITRFQLDQLNHRLQAELDERKRAEDALQESRIRLEIAVRAANIGFFDWNIRTSSVFYSLEWKSQLGYQDDELENSLATWENLLHDNDRERMIARVRNLLENPSQIYEEEFRLRHKDGTYRWILARGTIQFGADGKPDRMLGSHIDITERKLVEDRLERNKEKLRALAARLEKVREEDRKRIAREIHDELGQALTGIKIDLAWLSAHIPADQAGIHERLARMRSLVNPTIESVRKICTELRPGVLDDLGLVAAIEWQAGEFTNRTGIITHFIADPETIEVGPELSTALFRIFQESLTNVARHADATIVDVLLKTDAEELLLEIKDNGRGITEREVFESDSLGLLGVQERAHKFGAEVVITGTTGEGTTISVKIPIEREAVLETT